MGEVNNLFFKSGPKQLIRIQSMKIRIGNQGTMEWLLYILLSVINMIIDIFSEKVRLLGNENKFMSVERLKRLFLLGNRLRNNNNKKKQRQKA
jgi:hypothetical protein